MVQQSIETTKLKFLNHININVVTYALDRTDLSH